MLLCLDLWMRAVQEGRSEVQTTQWDEHLHPDAQALSSPAKPWIKANFMPRLDPQHQVWGRVPKPPAGTIRRWRHESLGAR